MTGPALGGAEPSVEESDAAPGSPQALDRGCACPTLANASYRVGADPTPLIDPTCPLHTD